MEAFYVVLGLCLPFIILCLIISYRYRAPNIDTSPELLPNSESGIVSHRLSRAEDHGMDSLTVAPNPKQRSTDSKL